MFDMKQKNYVKSLLHSYEIEYYYLSVNFLLKFGMLKSHAKQPNNSHFFFVFCTRIHHVSSYFSFQDEVPTFAIFGVSIECALTFLCHFRKSFIILYVPLLNKVKSKG